MDDIRKTLSMLLKFLCLTSCYFVVFAVALAIDTILLRVFWAWFITPFNVQEIDFKQALGLLILVHFLTYHFYNFKKEDSGVIALTDALSYLLIRPLILFLLACFAHFIL